MPYLYAMPIGAIVPFADLASDDGSSVASCPVCDRPYTAIKRASVSTFMFAHAAHRPCAHPEHTTGINPASVAITGCAVEFCITDGDRIRPQTQEEMRAEDKSRVTARALPTLPATRERGPNVVDLFDPMRRPANKLPI